MKTVLAVMPLAQVIAIILGTLTYWVHALPLFAAMTLFAAITIGMRYAQVRLLVTQLVLIALSLVWM